LAIFDEIVPLDQIEAGKMERIVAARRALAGSLHGYGKDGMKLYGTLSLPPPAPKKKERAA
jgi:hypothetical protein